MPSEVTAIVLKAEPGAELACRALDHRFEDDGAAVERGVISYYATETLPRATTVASWVALIEAAASADVRRGRITPFHQPALQVVGDAALRLPGVATGAGGAAPPPIVGIHNDVRSKLKE